MKRKKEVLMKLFAPHKLTLFSYTIQDYLPRVTLPTMGCALSYKSQIKKMPQKLAYRPIFRDIFSTVVSFSQITLACVKVTKNVVQLFWDFCFNIYSRAIILFMWNYSELELSVMYKVLGSTSDNIAK